MSVLFFVSHNHKTKKGNGDNDKLLLICKITTHSLHCTMNLGRFEKPRIDTIYQKIIYLAETGFVFKTLKDKPMDRIFVTKEIKRVAKRVINKNISAHTLRHSFATNLLKMTNNIKGVSSYLGHSDISTTLRMYIHSDLTMDDLALI